MSQRTLPRASRRKRARLVAVLLSLAVLLSAAACEAEPEVTDDGTTTEVTDAEAVDTVTPAPSREQQPASGEAPSAGDGSATGARIAGAAVGVGAAEVQRRALTPAEVQAIVREEVAERQTAAHGYERAGQSAHAERLRAEAEVLSAFLDDPGAGLDDPGA